MKKKLLIIVFTLMFVILLGGSLLFVHFRSKFIEDNNVNSNINFYKNLEVKNKTLEEVKKANKKAKEIKENYSNESSIQEKYREEMNQIEENILELYNQIL